MRETIKVIKKTHNKERRGKEIRKLWAATLPENAFQDDDRVWNDGREQKRGKKNKLPVRQRKEICFI